MMTINAWRLRLTMGWFICALVLGFALLPISAESATNAVAWEVFVRDYLDGYFALNPSFAAFQGRHEYDGRLPDWSEAGLQRKIAWLDAKRAEALAYKDNALDSSQRFERDYFIAQIRGDLFWLTTADAPHKNPYFYSGAIDPDFYVSRPYAPLPERAAAYIKYARSLPVALAQIRENLRAPQSQPLLKIGRQVIGGLADFCGQDIPKVFASALTGPLQAEFAEANGAAIKALKEFNAWCDEREKTATGNFALGPEKFRAMLRETEGVDLPLDALEAIAEKDLERNLQALQEACALYAPGKTVESAIALAWAHKPAGGVVTFARQQLKELEQFIRAHELLSIPGTEEAKVEQAPAYQSWNFAYINIPGPYEHGLPSIYYVAPPDPTWSQQKQDDYVPGIGSLLFTSAHEVWPGHFAQYLHANCVPSKFGQVFVGYGYAEGWAHYGEEMMWEAGLGEGSPEIHIGQLLEALERNGRFLAAIGLHTKGMTVEEAEKLFREKARMGAGVAEQQAHRGTFDPAYLNYTLGKLMVRKLRADWTATRGGRAAWREFHDRFLSYGGPPIPLVRRAMLGDADRGSLF